MINFIIGKQYVSIEDGIWRGNKTALLNELQRQFNYKTLEREEYSLEYLPCPDVKDGFLASLAIDKYGGKVTSMKLRYDFDPNIIY